MIHRWSKFIPVAEKVIPRKTFLEILRNVCVRDGYLIATDLDVTIRMKVEDDREYLIPIGIIKTVLKAKPKNIVIDDQDYRMRIDYDNKAVTFPKVEITDYPVMTWDNVKPIGTWNKNVVSCLYQQVPYCSEDELRPALQGVYVNQNGKLSSCATDGHTLRYVGDIKNAGNGIEKFTGIIPKRALMLLPRIVKDSVVVSESDESFHFIVDNDIEIIARKIDGTYPDFTRVVPKEYSGSISLDKSRFLKLSMAAKDFAQKSNHCSILTIDNDVLNILVSDSENDTSWESSMPVKPVKRMPVKMGFDLSKLEKVLNTVAGNETTWRYTDSNSAMIILEKDRDDITNLIMPIRIGEEA